MSQPSHLVHLPLEIFVPESLGEQAIKSVTVWCTSGAPAHWIGAYAFAEEADGYGGISLDMHTPPCHIYHQEEGNTFGTLKVTARPADSLRSSRTPFFREIPFLVRVTVRDVLDLIRTRNLQFYRFHPDISGCMFWQLTLLSKFLELGWVSAEKVNGLGPQIEAEVDELAKKGTKVHYPPIPGIFYTNPNV